MLVLTRKIEETIRIGDDITIKVIDIDNRQVKLGIQAPRNVAINREEVYLRIQNENKAASVVSKESQDGMLRIADLLKGRTQ